MRTHQYTQRRISVFQRARSCDQKRSPRDPQLLRKAAVGIDPALKVARAKAEVAKKAASGSVAAVAVAAGVTAAAENADGKRNGVSPEVANESGSEVSPVAAVAVDPKAMTAKTRLLAQPQLAILWSACSNRGGCIGARNRHGVGTHTCKVVCSLR